MESATFFYKFQIMLRLRFYFLILVLVFWTDCGRADEHVWGTLTYYINDSKQAVITGATSKNITAISIPPTVNYKGVDYEVIVRTNAFRNYKQLRKLVIEDCDKMMDAHYPVNNGFVDSGCPFEGCPLSDIYVGRNLSFTNGSGYFTLTSTASAIKLTFGGKATLASLLTLDKSWFTKITHLCLGGEIETFYENTFKEMTGLKHLTILEGTGKFDPICLRGSNWIRLISKGLRLAGR